MDRSLDLVAIGGNLHAGGGAQPEDGGLRARRRRTRWRAPSAICYGVRIAPGDLVDLADRKGRLRYVRASRRGKASQGRPPRRRRRASSPSTSRSPTGSCPRYYVEILAAGAPGVPADAYAYVHRRRRRAPALPREPRRTTTPSTTASGPTPTGDTRPADGPLADFTPHPTGHAGRQLPGLRRAEPGRDRRASTRRARSLAPRRRDARRRATTSTPTPTTTRPTASPPGDIARHHHRRRAPSTAPTTSRSAPQVEPRAERWPRSPALLRHQLAARLVVRLRLRRGGAATRRQDNFGRGGVDGRSAPRRGAGRRAGAARQRQHERARRRRVAAHADVRVGRRGLGVARTSSRGNQTPATGVRRGFGPAVASTSPATVVLADDGTAPDHRRLRGRSPNDVTRQDRARRSRHLHLRAEGRSTRRRPARSACILVDNQAARPPPVDGRRSDAHDGASPSRSLSHHAGRRRRAQGRARERRGHRHAARARPAPSATARSTTPSSPTSGATTCTTASWPAAQPQCGGESEGWARLQRAR